MKKNDINILVVEDDRNLGAVIVEALTRSGYRAVQALRPEDAISYSKVKTFHAAVIDCMLPKMNGVALAQALRKDTMKTEPIVFMSGIYKDKGFSLDAISKVNAIDFLLKPFAIDQLTKILDEQLASLISQPKIALHSLLSTPYSSSRDRRRALEQVDEVYGFDLPFILSVFLEDEFSGHINLVNESQEMFGLTLAKSMIAGVDTIDSVSSLSLLLVDEGFLSRDDLKEVQALKIKGEFLKALVENGFLSPHAAEAATRAYIESELNRLICEEKFKVAISPDRKMKPASTGISLNDFTKMYWPLLSERFPEQWLKTFYSEWHEHPLRKGPQHSVRESVLALIDDSSMKEIMEAANFEPTLNELLEKFSDKKINVLKFIHCMCSRRIFVFDIEKKTSNWVVVKDRAQKLLKDIENKDQEEVFIALGLTRPLRVTDVIKVYKEFAKGNHPDRIPENTDRELKEVVQKVFSIVSEAYQTLTDDTRRESYKKNVQHKKLEEQITAERSLDEIPKLINQGRFSEAEHMARVAHKILATDDSRIALVLSLLREGAPKAELDEADKFLGEISFEGRRTESYWIAAGRHSVCLNDFANAATSFRKAIEINPQSLEGRRGLMRVQSASGKVGSELDFGKMSATEILNADLGEMTKKFFKKHFG